MLWGAMLYIDLQINMCPAATIIQIYPYRSSKYVFVIQN